MTEADGLSLRQFAQDLYDGLLANMRHYDRATYGPEEYQRKGHSETTAHPSEWIAEREEFARAFNALVSEGTLKGFLERASCYECRGELEVTTETSETDWVYDETEAEWKARLADLPEITLLYGHKIGGKRD